MFADRLKKSLLQAAIQGQLTEQLPTDGDARDLLRKIRAEKTKLIADKKIKAEKPLPTVTDDEIPFDIPESWCWVRLGELCEHLQRGKSPKYSQIKKYPVVAQKCNQPWGFTMEQAKFIDPDTLASYSKERFLQIDDLLWNSTGLGTVGRVAIYDPLKNPYELAVADSHVTVIRLFKNAVLSRFVFSYIKSSAVQSKMDSMVSGSTKQKELATETVRNLIVPLPPFAEQTRIVEKLDVLLSEVDKLAKDERELVELEETFPRQMKNSLLQAAIQGKLTEQLPSDGDARDLLRKIRTEKAKLIATKKIKAEKPLPTVTDDEIPFDIPESWCWVRLGDVCQINPRNKLEDENIDATFLPMTAINEGYSNGYNPLVKSWNEIRSGFTHFADGDVIFAKITPCFQNRKSAIVKDLTNGIGAGTTELYVLRSYGKYINEKYLLYFVKNQQFILDGIATMKGTAGQQRISRNFVVNYLLPLPPFAEQKRIVERLEKLLPLC